MIENSLFGRDIVSLGDLTIDEITLILDVAKSIKATPKPELLNHKLLASCFFEPSTRTRLSFEAAMMRLGGNVIGFSDAHNMSSKKGESLQDAIKVIASYVDAVVLRHPCEGAARLAAEVSGKPIINGGDGANRHPSQTLLDLYTIRECQHRLDDLHIAFVGDLKYGRTVHSLAQALCLRKARFYFVSPDNLRMPDHICDVLRENGLRFSFHKDVDEVLDRLDIIYMTRLQKERFAEADRDKVGARCSLTATMLRAAKKNLKILHPLPRVDEIATDVDDTDYAYYFQQAENGLYVRQALLALLLNEKVSL